MTLHTHIQGRFNNYTLCILYRILVTATSVMAVTKMGNIVPRAGFEPASLAFWTSVLPFQELCFKCDYSAMLTCSCRFLCVLNFD